MIIKRKGKYKTDERKRVKIILFLFSQISKQGEGREF